MDVATRYNLEARARLSAPRGTRGLRNKLKGGTPRRVRELSYGRHGFYQSVAAVSHQAVPDARYCDAIGRLKVVGMYRLDGTVALLVCSPSDRRAPPGNEFLRYGFRCASRVVMLRRYRGRPPRWVDVRAKIRALGEPIATASALLDVWAAQGGTSVGAGTETAAC